VGTRNDDISLILAKAKKQGFLPDVKDSEVDILSKEAANIFGTDLTISKGAAPRANTFIIIGSSLTEQNGEGSNTLDASGGIAVRARGMFHWAKGFLGGAITLVRNAGIGGNRYDQMVARFDTDVLAYESDWVIIGNPTNSVTAGYTAAQIIADLNTMLDKCEAVGRRVVVENIPPRSTFTTLSIQTVVSTVNAYITDLAFTRRGVIPLDIWTPLADPATGFPVANTTVDGTHYSIAGAARLGKALADAIRNHIVPRPSRTSSSVDPLSVIANPQFLTNGSGWSLLSGTTGVVYEAASEGYGNKAKVTVSANASYTAIRGISTTELIATGKFAPGDIVQASIKVKWSNLVPLAAGTNTDNSPRFMLRHLTDSTITYTAESLYSATSEWINNTSPMPTSGEMILTTWRSTIGPTINRLDVILGWRGAASVDLEFERLAIIKGQ